MSAKKQTQLDDLKNELLANDVGAAMKDDAKQLVFGAGNPDAKIVFIGEAPGKKEDELGEPFVGASGKFLNELLASIDMSRDDVYITNIVKYRPPGNRDPSKQEKADFLPYLMKQIEIIQPTVIVTLGRHSMMQFLPEAKIGEVHGQKVTLENDVVLVPLYHPAAALYNGKMRQTLIDDFAKLKSYI